MSPDQFNQIKELIETTIQLKVNGKIDRMNQKLDDYIVVDNQWKSGDKEWKESAQPAIDSVDNAKMGGRFVVWLIGVLASIVTLYEVLKIRK
jgi:hypothetical protein